MTSARRNPVNYRCDSEACCLEPGTQAPRHRYCPACRHARRCEIPPGLRRPALGQIRVMLGPQDDAFTPAGIETFSAPTTSSRTRPTI
jgi:hypothetical protein